jgi:hypothetical protein
MRTDNLAPIRDLWEMHLSTLQAYYKPDDCITADEQLLWQHVADTILYLRTDHSLVHLIYIIFYLLAHNKARSDICICTRLIIRAKITVNQWGPMDPGYA